MIKFSTLAAVLMTSAAPALAQTACDPAKLAAAVDRYAAEPFGARSWRMLKGLGDPEIEPVGGGGDSWDARDAWKKLVAELAPGLAGVQEPDYACRIGYPLQVLKSRVAALGKEHPYIQQWLRAQEAVFQACAGSQAIAGLPEPLEVMPKDAKMQADDRSYQEASIAFYRDKQLAIQQFRRIAQADSPHRASARYNVANLLANAKQPAEARAEAQAILADSSASSVHTITKELLGYIANLEDTAAGWTSLIDQSVASIETPRAEIEGSLGKSSDYARALYDIDYVGIRAKDDDFWLEGKLPENPTVSKAIVDTARSHPIVPWMIAGQTAHGRGETVSWQYQTESWRAKAKDYLTRASTLAGTGKLPPLAQTALMSLATGTDDASREELWKQANDSAKRALETCGEAPETAAAACCCSKQCAHPPRRARSMRPSPASRHRLSKPWLHTLRAPYGRSLKTCWGRAT
ncbi:MAG: hypothetical protein HC855_15860 [Rhizobiales bacterium]|nr:hypothetical protein [Hyphomicrobiales bacterium]